MESKIVEDFQNLQVFAAYDFFKMDELVHDLTNALEESAHCKSKGRSGDCSKKTKRRCKKRKSCQNPMVAWELGNMSEASESSIDEAIKDYMESIAQQSDSDDLLMAAHHLTPLAALASNTMLSLPESDSVNENFSPMRPNRRRRRYKRMAVDPQNPRQMQELLDACGMLKERHVCPDQVFGTSDSVTHAPSTTMDELNSPPSNLLGKRKRGMKDRGSNSFDVDSLAEESGSQNSQNSGEATSQLMEANCISESGTSSLSSNESDGLHTNDESRDGDDEQSDFFHEAGPVCGVPGIVPWWENYTGNGGTSRQGNLMFDSIFQHMSSATKRKIQARLMMAPPGRPYRSGRRQLKDIRSVYSLSCFIHDRQQWTDHLKKLSSTRVAGSSSSSKVYDPKRRKKTPPQLSPEEGEISGMKTESASSLNSRILQNVSWLSGGLDIDGSSMSSTAPSCKRTWRQGFGTEPRSSQSYNS